MWKIVFKVNTNTHYGGWCSGAEGEDFNFTVGFLLLDAELKEELGERGENFGVIEMSACINDRGSGYCNAHGGTAEMIKLERLPGLEYDGQIIQNSLVSQLFSKPYDTVILLEGDDLDDWAL
jgi:hypothetical protein